MLRHIKQTCHNQLNVLIIANQWRSWYRPIEERLDEGVTTRCSGLSVAAQTAPAGVSILFISVLNISGRCSSYWHHSLALLEQLFLAQCLYTLHLLRVLRPSCFQCKQLGIWHHWGWSSHISLVIHVCSEFEIVFSANITRFKKLRNEPDASLHHHKCIF